MNNILLIGITVAAFAANGTSTRVFQLNYQKNKSDITLYQALFCFAASLCFLIVNKGLPVIDVPILVFGMAFGIFFCLMIIFSAECYECGPMSLTGIITNMSMIIPLIYSCAVYGESITPMQAVGIIFMIATIILAGIGKSDQKYGASRKWIVMVIIAFIANGLIAIFQKQYGISDPKGQINSFMLIAYCTSSILFTLYYFTQRRLHIKTETPVQWLPLGILSLISGIASFGGNGIATYLSNRVQASILYPCVNGGLCILLAAISFLVFKEKISKSKVFSIIIGLAAIVVLNL